MYYPSNIRKLILTLILVAIIPSIVLSQEFQEGKLLYRFENGSVFAMKDFKVRFKDKYSKSIADFSYETQNHNIITVIFENSLDYKILARYRFDSLPKPKPLNIETSDLVLNSKENELICLHKDATQKIADNYKRYFNPIPKMYFRILPLVTDENKKVIVFTRENKKSKNVILGNDFEFRYDSLNVFVEIKQLHDKIIRLPYNYNGAVVTFHMHQTDDIISSTDVCTLLLERDNIEWSQHVVLNDENASVFDVKKEMLILMMRYEWDNIVEKMRKGQ